MTINFSADDWVVVNTSYVNEVLAESSSENTEPALVGLGFLGTGTAQIKETGNLTVPSGSTLSYVRIVPSSTKSQAYRNGTGIYIYFDSDAELNNSFELASAFFKDTISIRCYNNTGSSISKGSIVRQTGFDSSEQLPTIATASAANASTSVVLGIAIADIANGAEGSVVVEGSYAGLDTSGFSLNDLVYLSDTAGQISAAAGTESSLIGRVLSVHASDGVVRLVPNLGGGSGGISGSTGATDNAILRADGTGGSSLQSSSVTVSDTGTLLANGVQIDGAASGGEFQLIDTVANRYQLKMSAALQYARVWINSLGKIWWTDGLNANTSTADVGIGRDSSGVLKINDGSTGTGSLISSAVKSGSTLSSDTATTDLSLTAQSAYTSAVTNQDGGNLVLTPGSAASGGGTDGKIKLAGHTIPSTDNTYDLGFGTRLRSVYAATSMIAGNSNTVTLQTGAVVGQDTLSVQSSNTMTVGPVTSHSAIIRTANNNRWECNSSGHLLAVTDNSYDIGASEATRPRNLYIGTSVVSPAISAGATPSTDTAPQTLSVTAPDAYASASTNVTGASITLTPGDGKNSVSNAGAIDLKGRVTMSQIGANAKILEYAGGAEFPSEAAALDGAGYFGGHDAFVVRGDAIFIPATNQNRISRFSMINDTLSDIDSVTDATNLSGVRKLIVVGGKLVALTASRITLVDPDDLTVLGSLSSLTNGQGLTPWGSYAVAVEPDYLRVFDCSGDTPIEIGTLNDATNLPDAGRVVVEGNIAYVAGGDGATGRLATIDLTDPTSPTHISTYTSADYFSGNDIQVRQGIVYLLDFFDRLSAIDARDPSSISKISILTDLTNLDGGRGMELCGDILAIACLNANHIAFVDVSNPSSMSLIGTLDAGGNSWLTQVSAVKWHGNRILALAGQTDHLVLIDPQGLSAPSASLGSLHATHVNVDSSVLASHLSAASGSFRQLGTTRLVANNVTLGGNTAMGGVTTATIGTIPSGAADAAQDGWVALSLTNGTTIYVPYWT